MTLLFAQSGISSDLAWIFILMVVVVLLVQWLLVRGALSADETAYGANWLTSTTPPSAGLFAAQSGGHRAVHGTALHRLEAHSHAAAEAHAPTPAPTAIVEAQPVAIQPKAPPKTPAVPDDLKRIEGIGPKLSSVLNATGITTFAALAAKSAEELQTILDAAGVARSSDPATWPEQAELAAEGQWDALATLQDTLKGGREVD